ncbi:MAG: sigma-54-dependent Fis family transcriptional regulator [Deltaproteobacteria bacterium]|nr:sigma-54-dependent Fis family transcriptional regulator [Deltaproteobacteria bacterium]
MTAGLAAADGETAAPFDIDETLGLLGTSPAIRKLRAEIRALGRSEFRAVLVQGESGVGKEVVTEALRLASRRAAAPYEVFDCPAVPEDHLESELFGTTRGAFPGAVDKAGALERAHGGTVFFDEIAAMRREHQAKVLRVIEGKGFRRVGGSRGITVDVAVIAAAHENLAALAAAGAFRHDLYYRLIRDGCLSIPPLRERPEDVTFLARHYLMSLRDPVPRIEPATMLLLMDHPWPGNVRQLQTVLRMALRSSGEVLDAGTMREVLARFDDAPGHPTISSATATPPIVAEGRFASSPCRTSPVETDFHVATARMQRQLLLDAFTSAAGNKTAAGILLGFHLSPGEQRVEVHDITDARRNLALRKFRYWCARLDLTDSLVRRGHIPSVRTPP